MSTVLEIFCFIIFFSNLLSKCCSNNSTYLKLIDTAKTFRLQLTQVNLFLLRIRMHLDHAFASVSLTLFPCHYFTPAQIDQISDFGNKWWNLLDVHCTTSLVTDNANSVKKLENVAITVVLPHADSCCTRTRSHFFAHSLAHTCWNCLHSLALTRTCQSSFTLARPCLFVCWFALALFAHLVAGTLLTRTRSPSHACLNSLTGLPARWLTLAHTVLPNHSVFTVFLHAIS